MTGTQEAASLFGREEQLAEVVRAQPPLLLLHGDSGIGKSALLRAAQDAEQDALTPEPVEVFASDGSAEQAILDGLSAALAALLLSEPRIGEQASVVDFVRRLASSAATDAGRVAGLTILGRLRDRFGDAAVEAVGEILVNARASIDAALASRISAARTPSTAEELTKLAAELCDLSGRPSLVLALDRLDILPDGDVRVLIDFARIAPGRVRLRGALMDASPQGRAVLELLRSFGGPEVVREQIGPLESGDVRRWLEHEHLDGALAGELTTLTGGYPLHLGDAILHLHRGGRLHDLPPNRDFGALASTALQGLDPRTREAARQLCILERPPPPAGLLALLSLAEPAWWDISAQLQDARIFTQIVDDQPWFHEQRRRWLLTKLSDIERQSYAVRAIPQVLNLLLEPAGWRYVPAFGEILDLAGEAIEDDQLRSVALLNPAQLAIMGALLELVEPDDGRAIGAQAGLDHARHFFGAEGDLISELETLKEIGLVGIASNERIAVVVPVFPAPVVGAVAGLCHHRLGRVPLPSLASLIWQAVLRPHQIGFNSAAYGIGTPAAGRLAHDLHISEMRRTRTVRPGFNGCVAYGVHRRTPIYVAADVEATNRDQLAVEWSQAEAEVGGSTFRVRDVVVYPAPRIRSERWSRVADDLLGTRKGDASEAGLDFASEIELESKLREAARLATPAAERAALGESDPMHIYFHEEQKNHLVVRVRGASPGSTRIERHHHARLFGDPFSFLRLTQDLDLPAGAAITQITTGSRVDRRHPLRVFGDISARLAAEFNREQPRIEIDLRPGTLEPWLEDMLDKRHQDATAMFGAIEDVPHMPAHLEVFLVTGPASPKSVIDTPNAAVAVRRSAKTRVNYALLDTPLSGWGDDELVNVFPDAEQAETRSGYASVGDAVADLAGFAHEDLSTYRSVLDLRLSTRQR